MQQTFEGFSVYMYIFREATAVPTKSVDSGSGWIGSVHDFLAGSGRVNRNGSDVLELGLL